MANQPMPSTAMRPIPDLIAPGCSAYLHLPPVWMVSAPTESELAVPRSLTREVLRTKLPHDINVRVRRDGVTVFDCLGWPDAGETLIPGYQPVQRQPVPRANTAAEDLAQQRAELRTQLVNAHLVCLCSASQGHPLGTMLLPSQVFHLYAFEQDALGSGNHTDPIERFAAELLDYRNPKLPTLPEFKQRHVIEQAALERSFVLLGDILANSIPDLLQLIDLLCRAASQLSQSRFAESLILSWAICERLLDEMWQRYIDARKTDAHGKARVNKERRSKLKGRDFSASIVAETLELAGELPFDLFEAVSEARQARNHWLHRLKPVGAHEASMALRTAEKLVHHVAKIRLSIAINRCGASGSVPKEVVAKWRASLNSGTQR